MGVDRLPQILNPGWQTDPVTGYLFFPEQKNFLDAPRKTAFVDLIRKGYSPTKASEEIGVDHGVPFSHKKVDVKFSGDWDKALELYVSDLEMVSRQNALNPKSVIERIFQLKANIPEKYGDKQSAQANVTINIDPKALEAATKRQEVLEATVIKPELLENKDV